MKEDRKHLKRRIKSRDMEQLANCREKLFTEPQLTFLFFELTTQCNLSCRHCGSSCSPKESKVMDLELAKKVLQEVAEEFDPNRIMICITGGEPMLYPFLKELTHNIIKLGYTWGMTTNGSFISPESVKELEEMEISTISVSLDGLEKTHDWFRRSEGNFKKTERAIDLLIGSNIYTQVTTVVHRKNIDELDKIYDYLLAHHIYDWRIIPIDPIGRAINVREELELESQDYKKLFNFIREHRYNRYSPMNIVTGCSHYLTFEYERELRPGYFYCGAGLSVASILADGGIYPCLDIGQREKHRQGDIHFDRFCEVWRNEFKEFRRDRTEDSPICSECPERRYCTGDSAHTWNFEEKKPMICFKKILGEK